MADRRPSIDLPVSILEGDPHAAFAGIRAMGSAVWIQALGGWMTTDHPTAVQVLRDPGIFTVDDRRFTTEQVVGRSMLSTDDPEHQRHREPFAHAYRRSSVERRSEAWLKREVDRLVIDLAPIGSAELRSELAGPVAVRTMIHSLGLVDVEPVELLELYRQISGAVTALAAGADADASAAVDALREAVARSAGEGTALSEIGRSLTSEELFSNVAVMLFGGIETGEGMTANLFWRLLISDWWDRIRRASHLWEAAIEETLRLEPAATRVDRYATADVRLGSASVRRGDLVIVSLAAANRDASVFSDPHDFDPTRTNLNRQLAFAQGPHLCIGRHLARLQTRISLESVARHLPELRLVREQSQRPSGLVFRKPPKVTVTW